MADTIMRQSSAGQYTGAALTAAGTAIYTGNGIVELAVFTASGTGTFQVYDSIVSASGTILYSSTAATGVGGTPITIRMPFQNGIYVISSAGGPAVTISYSKGSQNGTQP